MHRLAFWVGGSPRQIIRLLSVIALGTVAFPTTMMIAHASPNKGPETSSPPAYNQALEVTPVATGTPILVTICHHTGSASNPYVQINVEQSSIPAHHRHGDIIPAPAGGCPAVTPGRTRTVRPVPTGTITVQSVLICHRTGSQQKPYVMINISTNAIRTHASHGDIIPAPVGGCPSVAPGGTAVIPKDGAHPGNGMEKSKGKLGAQGQQKEKDKDSNDAEKDHGNEEHGK